MSGVDKKEVGKEIVGKSDCANGSNKSLMLEEVKKVLSGKFQEEEEDIDSLNKDSETSSKDTKETPQKDVVDLSKVTRTLKPEHSLYDTQASISK